MSIQDELCAYINDELLDDDEPITADDNLLADGTVDSMGMLRLVAHIGEKWNVQVPAEDFTIENFRTVTAIDAYLRARMDSIDAT